MTQTQKGLVFILVGPTAAGKNTIIKEIQNVFPEVKYLITCTTRQPRDGETQGNPYWFLSDVEFEAMLERGELLEWQLVHGNKYGTPVKEVSDAVEGGYDAIRDIEVFGALEVMKKFPEQAITIFLLPPSIEEIKRRLIMRGKSDDDDMAIRLRRAEMELTYIPHFKYLVRNFVLEEAVKEVVAIITAERAHRAALNYVNP